jgi:FkbM family methyltransferase
MISTLVRAANALAKPEYLFRPVQLLRRARLALLSPQSSSGSPLAAVDLVRLPWGAEMYVRRKDNIGSAIATLGVYDLPVTETILRLLEEGDLAVDVGANVGFMTHVMAHAVGARGRVISFEPHPGLLSELRQNVGTVGSGAHCEVMPIAVSSAEGSGYLAEGDMFEGNRGTARIADDSRGIAINLTTLDRALCDEAQIGLMKIDIEGFELEALRGAAALLSARRIRHLIVEEHGTPPTPVTSLLEAGGYSLFQLGMTTWGPRLTAIGEPILARPWEARSILATLDPVLVQHSIAVRGWRALTNSGGQRRTRRDAANMFVPRESQPS